ncbi:17329_t:CDS:2 [Rhizophagus irregularis]|nr:17329_t:CDS:2 [Rhizophagus irregularis]
MDDTNNDLLMTDIMKDDFREQIDKQPDELVDYENSDVDFEAILDEELGLN